MTKCLFVLFHLNEIKFNLLIFLGVLFVKFENNTTNSSLCISDTIPV